MRPSAQSEARVREGLVRWRLRLVVTNLERRLYLGPRSGISGRRGRGVGWWAKRRVKFMMAKLRVGVCKLAGRGDELFWGHLVVHCVHG